MPSYSEGLQYTAMKKLTCVLAVIMLAVSIIICSYIFSIEPADTAADNRPETSDTDNSPSVTSGDTSKDSPVPQVTTAAEPAPAVPSDIRLTFLAAGDNLVHEQVFVDAARRADSENPKYNFLPMYNGIAELVADADISFINQETIMAGEKFTISGYPAFNTPWECGDALVTLGFDIINIANNHMLDKWESGFVSALDYWATKDVMLLGAYKKSDYDDIRVYEKDGVKIAFLSYTYGANPPYAFADDSEYLLPVMNKDVIKRQVALAKEAGDLVFVSMHWGTENVFAPDKSQKEYADLLVELGVDVVIGHHPHVVQKVEQRENSEGHSTLIYYSLGNLINTMHPNKCMVGGLASFEIVKEADGDAYIENPLFIPTVCYYNTSRLGLQMYLMEDFTEELANSHGSQLKGAFTFATLKKYITDNIDSKYLPYDIE